MSPPHGVARMRFLPAGPDIPKELVAAQEKGQTIFVCGAGVSRTAGLPLFQGLVEGVYAYLGEDWQLYPAEREGMRPDRALQFRILLGPVPSLHELRRSRGRFVRSLLRYFGQVRLLPHTHRRLRPPAFPTTSRPRLVGTAMEISRFPCKRLLRMPGSTTTRGRHVSCVIDTSRVAFCGTENISTPNLSYAAQYLACALPCERFTSALADTRASLGASAVRYSFTVTDFHRLPLAGLPAHPSTHEAASQKLGGMT